MARPRTGKGLSVQPDKGYKVSCGKHVGRDGTLKPKTFYLNTWDAKKAERLVLEIRLLWKRLELSTPLGGTTVWGEAELKQVECLKAGIDIASVTDQKNMMSHDALDKYIEYVQTRKIKDGRKRTIGAIIKSVREFVLPDLPMKGFGHNELMALTKKVSDRPTFARGKISADYATCVLCELRMFFSWGDASGIWDPPRGFYTNEELLRGSVDELTTEAERLVLARKKVFYTVDELVEIFPRLGMYWQCMVALSLNTSFGPEEIATLRNYQVFIDAETPFIRRLRGKTKQEAEWVLWPETAELMKKVMVRSDDPMGLVFEGPRGGPINEGIQNKITTNFVYYKKKLGLRLPFKHFRKTGAQFVRQAAGLMAAEMQLSHAKGAAFRRELMTHFECTPEDAVAAAYTTATDYKEIDKPSPGYEHVFEAIRRTRMLVLPMFESDKPKLKLAV